MQHRRDATCAAEVIIDEAGVPTLYHFQLIDVSLSRWVPDCAPIFHDWADQGLVTQDFSVARTGPDVALEKGACRVGFL